MSKKKTLLVVSQVYLPDPAAVGMLLADACAEMVERGYRVRVLTADRGYDDPTIRHPRQEVQNGVEILRLPFSSFGKSSILTRLLSGTLFTTQAALAASFLSDVDALLISTSPPMVALSALWLHRFRKLPIAYWAMDLNPDQMVALGRISPHSPATKAFDLLNRAILKRAKLVVTLDKFMARRLNRKYDVSAKLEIIPPWPLDNLLEPIEHADNPFRREHGLGGKFVIMYSGNHGPSSPVTTCLQAASRLRERKDLVFLFVGGGTGKVEVEEAIASGAMNVRSLPYQPQQSIKYSLSAADVHLVTVGNAIVGVVHPCKIYGAMSIGRPILLNAPEQSHASPLVVPKAAGIRVENDDVDRMVHAIMQFVEMPKDKLHQMGERAKKVIANDYSRNQLRGRFADRLIARLGLSSESPST